MVLRASLAMRERRGKQRIAHQHIQCRRIHILELPGAQRPEEGQHGGEQQQQADWDQQQQDIHAVTASRAFAPGSATRGARASRSEFSVTSSEDNAMPSAASHGSTWPVAASGSAAKL